MNAMRPPEPDLFHALADPTRRAVLERLAAGESTVTQLQAGLHVSQPAVSQHLATLRRARLVTSRRAGRNVYYRAQPEGLAPLLDWIVRYRAFWREHMERLTTLLEEMPE